MIGNTLKTSLGGAITTPHKQRFDALDGLRVIACIGIVLMHVKSNIAVKPTSSFLVDNIISFTGDFVSMFMMVSAFGLCCGYFERFVVGTIKPNDFYSKRYKRVLPFFALLTMIDVAMCAASEHLHFTDTLIGELWEAFANMTLAFGLIPGHGISVVGVGWFLGVIFLFYMLFPFFVFLMGTKKRAWFTTLVSVGLYLSVQLYFNPVKGVGFSNASFMHCAPFFMVGGLLYLYRETITKTMTKTWAKLAMAAVTIGYTAWFFACPEMRFTLSNLVMYAMWLIYAISEVVSDRKWTLLNNRVMAFASGISMEIYLCHMMFFRMVEKLHLENKISDNDVQYWLTCVLALLGAGCFGWCWKKFEKRYLM